jgi:hypothetical protein
VDNQEKQIIHLLLISSKYRILSILWHIKKNTWKSMEETKPRQVNMEQYETRELASVHLIIDDKDMSKVY